MCLWHLASDHFTCHDSWQKEGKRTLDFVCLNNNGFAFRKSEETKHPLCCEVVEMLDPQTETAPTFLFFGLDHSW